MSLGEIAESSVKALFDTKCVRNFERMPSKQQTEIAVKVTLLALAAGIFCRLADTSTLGTTAAIIVVGIGAFAYSTREVTAGNRVKGWLEKVTD